MSGSAKVHDVALRGVSCPWDFSTPGTSETAVPNLPTELGAEAGRELARLTRPLLERDRARFPDGLPPCSECAFVEGTIPNRSPATVLDAVKCVAEQVPFFCHKGVVDEMNPSRLCAGWVAAVGA